MSADLNTILAEQFSFVKSLSNKESKKMIVMRHRYNGKEIVKIDYTGNTEIYDILKTIRCRNLPIILSTSYDAGRCMVIEEYINGMTVADVLKCGLYNEKGVKKIVCELCNALNVLHLNKIIYRDIKPENVIISDTGDIKLIDFDAARIYKNYQQRDTDFIGTSGFAAPEQFGITQSDERTDIFALGIMMNTMLTGEHPSKRLYKGKLTQVIETCINIDPNKRYHSVVQLYNKI